jgi:nucleoside-diphosphate-sugar epimerase
MRGQQAVVHLAAVVGKDPGGWENHLLQGVQGTENVLRSAADAGVPRCVHLSSCVVYRAPADATPINEQSPLEDRVEPWNHYLRQKLSCEELAARPWRGLAVTVIRPPTVLGAGDPNLLPYLSAVGRSPLGALARDGERHFPVVVAEDLASGIASALERPAAANRTYNLAARQALSKAELLGLFERAGAVIQHRSRLKGMVIRSAGSSLDWLEAGMSFLKMRSASAPRKLLVRRLEDHAHRRAQPDLVVDSSRAQQELDFEGASDVALAIQRVVDWQRAQPA